MPSLSLATSPVTFSAFLASSNRFASLIALSVLSVSGDYATIIGAFIYVIALYRAIIQLEKPHVVAVVVGDALALHLALIVRIYVLEFLAYYSIKRI